MTARNDVFSAIGLQSKQRIREEWCMDGGTDDGDVLHCEHSVTSICGAADAIDAS